MYSCSTRKSVSFCSFRFDPQSHTLKAKLHHYLVIAGPSMGATSRATSSLLSGSVGLFRFRTSARFAHSILLFSAIMLITFISHLYTPTKRSMYKGIVKKQVSDGPRLKPGRFCLMGRQSRSNSREWDCNRMSMSRQWACKGARSH